MSESAHGGGDGIGGKKKRWSGGAELGAAAPHTAAAPHAAAHAEPLPAGLQRGAEWDAIMQTQLRPGDLLKLVAAAGAGKSTVLREYARLHPELQTAYFCVNHEIRIPPQSPKKAHCPADR